MKHGFIFDNIKAFAGGCIGSAAVFFKPIMLTGNNWVTQGVLLTLAIFVLKLIGLSVISLCTGAATAWGADLYKNLKAYNRFKNKNKKDDRPKDEKNGRAA